MFYVVAFSCHSVLDNHIFVCKFAVVERAQWKIEMRNRKTRLRIIKQVQKKAKKIYR